VFTSDYGSDGLRRHEAVTDVSASTTTTTDYLLDGQSVVRSFSSEGASKDKAWFTGPRGPECEVTGYAQTLNGVTTRYALDGQSVVQEWKPETGGTDWVTYLTGTQGPLCRREEHKDSGGTVTDSSSRWYVYDAFGSVIGGVDETGDLKSSGLCDVNGAARTAWKESGESAPVHSRGRQRYSAASRRVPSGSWK
jgi:hypothetical protein